MGSSKSKTFKEPATPQPPSDKIVDYGSTSPVIPPNEAYQSYITPGQVSSGGTPINIPQSGASGAPPAPIASTASQAPASGQMSEVDRLKKLIAMGIAPRDLLAILMAAKDPEPDFDIWSSRWGSGGSR